MNLGSCKPEMGQNLVPAQPQGG